MSPYVYLNQLRLMMSLSGTERITLKRGERGEGFTFASKRLYLVR